jgi:predicted transcriptional regulator
VKQLAARKRKKEEKDTPKELMVEGAQKKVKQYSAQETRYIRERRDVLIENGLTDNKIAKILEKEISHPGSSIESKIRDLVKEGRLQENPNKRVFARFSKKDIETIIRMRKELIAKGLSDVEIAKKIAEKIDRKELAVYSKIQNLRKIGELTSNPNQRRIMSKRNVQTLMERREQLILEGRNDKQISKVIAQEMDLPESVVYRKILLMIRKNKVKRNKNKKQVRRFTKKEIDTITSRRPSMISDGLTDGAIAKTIAYELDRYNLSVVQKIKELVNRGVLSENPNKLDRDLYDEKDTSLIISLREDLAQQDLADHEIAEIIAKKMGRGLKSIRKKIQRLVERGVIEENKVKNKDFFSDKEIEKIRNRRDELIEEGLQDLKIAEIISEELSRSKPAIYAKILRLVGSGKFRKNPKMKKRKASKTTIQAGLIQAADAMEQFGDLG